MSATRLHRHQKAAGGERVVVESCPRRGAKSCSPRRTRLVALHVPRRQPPPTTTCHLGGRPPRQRPRAARGARGGGGVLRPAPGRPSRRDRAPGRLLRRPRGHRGRLLRIGGRFSGDDYSGCPLAARRFRAARHRSVTLWRSRRKDDGAVWRYTRRALTTVGVVALSGSLLPTAIALRRDPHRARGRSGRQSRRDAGGRGLHDERWAASRGLVRSLSERCDRDRVPGSVRPAEARPHADPARLRRAALRPPRGGRERRRPEHVRLGRRPRSPRRRARSCKPAPTSIATGSAA